MAHVLLIEGSRACFRRPEISRDIVTYDVITPIAARRLFETVHWTPAIRWRVERIDVLHAIRTEWVIDQQDRGPRMLHLIDVSYAVHARFDVLGSSEEHPAKHAEMFRRKAQRQQYAKPPHLGRHGFGAYIRPVDPAELPPSDYEGSGSIDLGWMVGDHAESDGRGLQFYRPLMIDGVIDLRAVDPDATAE